VPKDIKILLLLIKSLNVIRRRYNFYKLSATSTTKILETIISRTFQLVADVLMSTFICY